MTTGPITRLVIKGFKSIRECDITLGNLNVLIGPNGAGKSNFIGFFKFLEQMARRRLKLFVSKQGGPDVFLHYGRENTDQIFSELYFDNHLYQFSLESTQDNYLIFSCENLKTHEAKLYGFGGGHMESLVLAEPIRYQKHPTVSFIRNMGCFHFNDTSDNARLKQRLGENDNVSFHSDGSNLAPFLFRIKKNYPGHYQRILKTIQLVAPFIEDFPLRLHPDNRDQIELEWKEFQSDVPFKAYQLSDGTLRFICLAVALLQPDEFMPSTILIDEPELGLHPYAINILAGLIRSLSHSRQVIISTQSVELLNNFEPENVIVVDRQDSCSKIHRLKVDALDKWLEDYSLGELWLKNILGGGPVE